MGLIFPLIATFIFWVIFFMVTNIPSVTLVAFGILLVWCVIVVTYIGGRSWYRQWSVWMCYLFLMLSSFGLLLIIESVRMRNIYIIIMGIVSGLLTYTFMHFSREASTFKGRGYLELINFAYLLTLWQTFVLLYFVIITYDVSVWSSLAIAVPLSYVLSRGIVTTYLSDARSMVMTSAVLTLTTIELYIVFELLPLTYYVLATLVIVWFITVIEIVRTTRAAGGRQNTFSLYTLLMVIAIVALLITAQWP